MHLRAEICFALAGRGTGGVRPRRPDRHPQPDGSHAGTAPVRRYRPVPHLHDGQAWAFPKAAFAEHVETRQALGDRVRGTHERAAVDAAQRFGAVLASHDDTTAGHVARSAAHGIALAEFPTTEEAARACRQHGIAVMMGAPEPDPGRVAFRQRLGRRAGRGRLARYRLLRLRALGAALLRDAAGGAVEGLAARDGDGQQLRRRAPPG